MNNLFQKVVEQLNIVRVAEAARESVSEAKLWTDQRTRKFFADIEQVGEVDD